MNLLLEKPMPRKCCKELSDLLTAIDKANPGSKWSRIWEKMGGERIAEIYSLNGKHIIAIDKFQEVHDERTKT